MKVLICGAGIAGLSLAWSLHRRGHEATLIEKSPSLRGEGYMIDFFGSGYDAAERLGLLPDLERIHYPVGRLVLVDGAGRERFSIGYPLLRRRLFGDRHFNFLRGDLEAVLYARVKDFARIRLGVTIESLGQEADHVRAQLSDGSVEEAEAAVGADGVHSRVRGLLFGAADFERPLGFRAAAFVLDRVPAALSGTADFVTLTVPNRQVAVYPIRGGRLAAFLLHRSAPGGSIRTEGSGLGELRSTYGDLGWIVPALLDPWPSDRGLYLDSVSQVALPSWSSGRATLVGDACQCVSLLAGQGASLAMAGAYVLAEELDRSSGGVPEALAAYERRLRPSVVRKQAAGRRIAGWFVPSSRLRLALRDLMFRAWTWPTVAPIARRSLAADSVFGRSRDPLTNA